MLSFILIVAFLVAAGSAISLALRARRFQRDLQLCTLQLQERDDLLHQHIEVNHNLIARNAGLVQDLNDAYMNLQMALEASPGPFNDVTVEISTNGLVYQFHSLEKEEAK